MAAPVTLRLMGENGQLVGVLRATAAEQEKYKQSTEGVRKGLKATTEEASLFDKGLTSLKGSAVDLARTLASGLGLAGIAGAITYAIVQSRDFNKEIAKVSTALADTSNLQDYSRQLREMAIQYGLAAKSQAASLYEIISAGQDAETAMRTLDAANRLAVGGLTTVEVAADGLTSVLNAYSGKVRDAAEVSDILFVAAAQGKTNIEQLSSTLGQVAPIASSLNVEFSELAAAIATLTLSGVSTNIAVTQTRAILNALIKPSKEAADLAKTLGLEFNSSAVAAKGFSGFLEDVKEKTGGSQQAIATLFGSVEAIGGVLALTGNQAAKFGEVLEATANSAGATDVAFGKMAATADQAFKRAQVAAQDLFITLGNRLLTALAPLAISFADNIKGIAVAIELAAKVTAAYVVVFVALPAAYNIATVAGWRFVAMLSAQNVGMLASIKSIGLMQVAAGVLFAAFAGWQIGTTLSEEFVEVRVFGIAMINGLLNAWERLKYGVTVVWESIKLAAQVTMDAILESFAVMLRAVASAGDVEIFGEKVFSGAVGDINALADSISGLLKPYDGFKTAVNGAATAMNKQIKANDEILGDMADMELATSRVAKTQKVVQTATNAATQALAVQEEQVELTKEEMNELAQAYEASANFIEEQIKSYMNYQQARTRLEESYANEIALLGMSTKERKVGVEMLRYMQDNYEYLTSLSGEAAKAELKHAESVIRTGEAALDAASDVQVLVDQFSGLNDVGLFGLIDDIQKVSEELERVSDKDLMGEAFDPERVKELQETVDGLNQQLASDIVGSFKASLEAAQTFTKEGSSGFKAMEKGIAALSIVQDVLALKAAVTAVLTQGEGDPYSAFARMAAMAAAVAPFLASIGQTLASIGGGGGGTSSQSAEVMQQNQGTGTILGDAEAKSESILNAMEITADATSELVGINRGMLRALQTLESGIGSAAGMIARGAGNVDVGPLASGTGGLLGSLPSLGLTDMIFGGSQELIDQGIVIMGGALNDLINSVTVGAYNTIETDGGWFSGDDTDTNLTDISAEFGDQFSLIIESISNTVREGALALGLLPADIEDALARFQVESINISLMGLDAEEQQAELAAVFSSIFDGLAGSVVPFIEQFQELGEGLGETLVRVATSVQVTQEAMLQLGFALDQTDPETFAQIAVGLIDLSGGIDGFIEGMSTFVNAFATDEHKFAVAQDEITRALEQYGLAVPPTREAMWELMQSLDATTESGREQIATLLRLAGVSDSYYSMLEDQAESATEAAEAAAAAVEEALRAAAEEAAALEAAAQARVEALANGLTTLRGMYAAPVDGRTGAIDDINSSFEELSQALADTNADIFASIALENERTEAIARANAQIDAEINGFLDNLAFDLNVEGLSEAEIAIARINMQYDEYRDQLISQGATIDQLTRLEDYRTEALDAQTQSMRNNTEAIAAMNDAFLAFYQQLRENIAKFYGDGAKSWLQELTGLTLRESAPPAATRSGATAQFLAERAAYMHDLNDQLMNLNDELDALPWFSQTARGMVQRRIDAITEATRTLDRGLSDALQYINDVFDQQIGDTLSSLAQEFGDFSIADQINARFDALAQSFADWGASSEALAELEEYRQQALLDAQEDQLDMQDELLDAEEEGFQQQMEWIRRLSDYRQSLLLDEQLSTLTDAERLAEAKRQLDEVYAAALAGDLDAQNTFESIADQYLQQLRSFFATGDEYTAGFEGVLQMIEDLLNATNLTDISIPPPPPPPASPGEVVSGLLADNSSNSVATSEETARQTDALLEELRAIKQNTAANTDAINVLVGVGKTNAMVNNTRVLV